MKYLKLLLSYIVSSCLLINKTDTKQFGLFREIILYSLHFNFIPNLNDYNLQHNPSSIFITLNKNFIFLNMISFLVKQGLVSSYKVQARKVLHDEIQNFLLSGQKAL